MLNAEYAVVKGEGGPQASGRLSVLDFAEPHALSFQNPDCLRKLGEQFSLHTLQYRFTEIKQLENKY